MPSVRYPGRDITVPGVVVMLLFESSELEQTEEFLSAHYSPLRIGSPSARFRARISHAASDRLSVNRFDLGFEMSYDVEPLGRIALCDVEAGTFLGHAPDGSAPQDFGAGELFILAPPDRPYEGTLDHARYTLTLIDPEILGGIASAPRGETVRLLDHRPVDQGAARRLRAAVSHLDEVVLGEAFGVSSRLVVAAAEQYVAAQLLATFPSNVADEVLRDSRDAHPAALRRAVIHIEAHAQDDLTPTGIAAAAHVSVRSLQLAFRRHLDSTPMGYVRQVRLAGVHIDLVAGGADDAVAEISARWGFRHQGHFGQAYREAYGETPGTTLRRGD